MLDTAGEIAARVREREVSAQEVVEAHIRRIEALDGAINAVVTRVFDRARERAAAADRALAAGQPIGPLHGVPFTLKDAHWTAGIRTTVGLPELRDHVPDVDGVAAARLQAAGAILLGKSNVPPMLMSAQTDNPVLGRTSNPWDRARTAGGSSVIRRRTWSSRDGWRDTLIIQASPRDTLRIGMPTGRRP
jgi:amidase